MAAAGVGVGKRRHARRLDRFLVNLMLLGGLLAVIVAVQLVVLLALGRFPTDEEGTLLAASVIAAAVAALLFQPVRARLESVAGRLLPDRAAGDRAR